MKTADQKRRETQRRKDLDKDDPVAKVHADNAERRAVGKAKMITKNKALFKVQSNYQAMYGWEYSTNDISKAFKGKTVKQFVEEIKKSTGVSDISKLKFSVSNTSRGTSRACNISIRYTRPESSIEISRREKIERERRKKVEGTIKKKMDKLLKDAEKAGISASEMKGYIQ